MLCVYIFVAVPDTKLSGKDQYEYHVVTNPESCHNPPVVNN